MGGLLFGWSTTNTNSQILSCRIRTLVSTQGNKEGELMSAPVIVDGFLKPDGTLRLDSVPQLPTGRVRVTLQALPSGQDEEDFDWAELNYDSVPPKRAGQVKA